MIFSTLLRAAYDDMSNMRKHVRGGEILIVFKKIAKLGKETKTHSRLTSYLNFPLPGIRSQQFATLTPLLTKLVNQSHSLYCTKGILWSHPLSPFTMDDMSISKSSPQKYLQLQLLIQEGTLIMALMEFAGGLMDQRQQNTIIKHPFSQLINHHSLIQPENNCTNFFLYKANASSQMFSAHNRLTTYHSKKKSQYMISKNTCKLYKS